MPHKTAEARKAYARRRYLKNRVALLSRQKEWRRKNVERHREATRRWNAIGDNYERRKVKERARYYTKRDSILFHKYGLREKDVAALLILQGGGCAICRGSHLLGVDHDHETGEVRGILCRKCNSGLGQFNDRLELVRNGIAYLESPPARKRVKAA
jgi:hypothetical protein